jgi:hypothetical protein
MAEEQLKKLQRSHEWRFKSIRQMTKEKTQNMNLSQKMKT